MYKYFIIILIFLGSLFSMETVAIIDLEPFGVSSDEAKALTQRLTSQMIQIGRYTIVERSEMKRLLDEQKFQYSGCVDVACAVEIGKMLGAKTMVVGSVSKVGMVYSVDARMIDVKSAENYISADYTATDDIGDLLIEGMKSIAYQLCEKEYTKSNIKTTQVQTNQKTPSHKTIGSFRSEMIGGKEVTVIKIKKGKISLTTEPPMADVKIDGTVFENNSLFDYGKHRYKISHPYYYTQTSTFILSEPIYEENIILKSGKKDFRKLRKQRKLSRITSIISLVGLGISNYLHEDAYDKYNSATTPDDATKYREITSNMYNVQMAFGGLSTVSVLYTINLENKFSKLKKALSIKNPKKKQNQKQKKKQKQNKNRKRNQ